MTNAEIVRLWIDSHGGETFTTSAVQRDTRLRHQQIRDAFRNLRNAGVIEPVGTLPPKLCRMAHGERVWRRKGTVQA